MRAGIREAASSYRKMSRYFFYCLVIIGLIGTVTGAFAQSLNQPLPLTVTLSNVKVNSYDIYGASFIAVGATVTVQGAWNGGPLHFGGWVYVVGHITGPLGGAQTTVNDTIDSGGFNPSSLNYPSSVSSNLSYVGQGLNQPSQMDYYTLVINAYNQNNTVVGTSGSHLGVSNGNLYILVVELPLFQVPQLGITASNPTFTSLFATFDQLPLGGYYMLLAEVAVIFLIGAGMINFILYLMGGGGGNGKGDTKRTLAGLDGLFVTLLMIFLLPFAYNAIAGFANILNQQIIAGPNSSYTTYNVNIATVSSNLAFGGDFFTDIIGWIASIIVWVMEWMLGTARLFLIGSVIVAMPIVLVLRDIRFTARFAGTIEDTFFGIIFASVISALFLGLAANILNNYGGSIFSAAGVEKNWVALAALLGAILAPTVFAPLTGVFFQTMSQVGMASAGTAIAIGAGAAGPATAGMSGGISAAGQAVSGLPSGAGFSQKAGAALGGFGGAFGRAVPHMAQNMALMGTVGTLGGMGASRSAASINRAIDIKMPAQTSQSIVTYRGGMLATELKLPFEMRGIVGRALGVGVPHEEVRMLDSQYHENMSMFESALRAKIDRLRVR
ncbi:MAG: hypothetical protein HY247_08225 [archaeon]|nr:MAG: hypothetical protein HY247_08225 [archaeon]